MDLPAALYVPTDDGFEATALTIGPWDAGAQHAGPPAALLAREVERAGGDRRRPDRAAGLRHPRPGAGRPGARRRDRAPARAAVELVEAALCGADDRPLMRLTAWRMRIRDDGATPADAAAGAGARPGRSRAGRRGAEFFRQEVAYHRALDWRFAAGSFNAPGPAAAWTRPPATWWRASR